MDKFDQIERYMDAMHRQLLNELKRFKASEASISSVFIGGGTPSTVRAELYTKTFEAIAPYLQKDVEITTEANPNSATPEWLKGMKALGCTRVSFGVQSFNDTKLKFLGREHNSQQAVEAVKNAHKAGFKHISLDLIYATKMDTKAILDADLEAAFSLPIDHISAYALTIEENTLFEAHPEAAKEKLELSTHFMEAIKSHGFEQYEISNFGTYRCRHNIGYWELEDYMGVGAGAVGMLANQRFYPQTDIEAYIEEPLKVHIEELSDEELKTERIFLGLRSCVGIDESIFSPTEQHQLDILLNEARVTRSNHRIYNTDFLLSDEIALFLQP